MEWFLKLDENSQTFLKSFLISSGSLKKLAQEYGVSYPTIRLWLDQLIYKVEETNAKNTDFESQIFKMVETGELSIDNAKKIIKKYQEN